MDRAATRAFSVTAVENDFFAKVYENLAWAYDYTFGTTLHKGRLQAIKRRVRHIVPIVT